MTDSAVMNPKKKDTADSMQQFLRDVGVHQRLTPEQELELAKKCAKGDEEAIKAMVTSNLRLVVSIARQFAGRGVPMLDLIQEGSIGLITAAKKYDYTLENRFSTYATDWIRQGVARCVMDHSGLIRVPHYTAERMNKLLRAKAELTQQTGAVPTVQELAAHCGMEQETVTELLSLCPQVYSLDFPVGSNGEDDLQVMIENLQAPQPEEELVRQELKNTLDTLLSMLTERQQEILRLRYGLADGQIWSAQKIGDKFGISKQRVLQIERQAMEILKKKGADLGLEDFLT